MDGSVFQKHSGQWASVQVDQVRERYTAPDSVETRRTCGVLSLDLTVTAIDSMAPKLRPGGDNSLANLTAVAHSTSQSREMGE